MTRYMIWNKFNNQTVPSVFDSLDKALSVLKSLVPNLENLVDTTSEEDFNFVLKDLDEWEIISIETTGITSMSLSKIQESPAWKKYRRYRGIMTSLDNAITLLNEKGARITPTCSVKYGTGFNLNTGTIAGCLVFIKGEHLVFIRGGQAFVIENDIDGFPPDPYNEIKHQVRLSKGVGETFSDNWNFLL